MPFFERWRKPGIKQEEEDETRDWKPDYTDQFPDPSPNAEERLAGTHGDETYDYHEIDLSSEEHAGPYDTKAHGNEPYDWEHREDDERYMAHLGKQMMEAEHTETQETGVLRTPSQGSVEHEHMTVNDSRFNDIPSSRGNNRPYKGLTDTTTWKNSRPDQHREAA